VLAPHCDNLPLGSHTGWVPPEAVQAAGAVGTLLNHAERPLPEPTLRATVSRCRDLGLETVVCAHDLGAAKTAAAVGPTFLAVEPPELIGGDVSVTTANPQVVRRVVDEAPTNPIAPNNSTPTVAPTRYRHHRPDRLAAIGGAVRARHVALRRGRVRAAAGRLTCKIDEAHNV
ncbi:MAG: triose-phosphate isomerase, partial [Phycisphaerae bacterium]